MNDDTQAALDRIFDQGVETGKKDKENRPWGTHWTDSALRSLRRERAELRDALSRKNQQSTPDEAGVTDVLTALAKVEGEMAGWGEPIKRTTADFTADATWTEGWIQGWSGPQKVLWKMRKDGRAQIRHVHDDGSLERFSTYVGPSEIHETPRALLQAARDEIERQQTSLAQEWDRLSQMITVLGHKNDMEALKRWQDKERERKREEWRREHDAAEAMP